MLTIVLTRHGSTARSVPEQHLGQRIDIPLSDAGRAAASALGRRLAGVHFDRVIASPLKRASETASLVVPGRPFETDARLMEMDYGRWEGLTYEQIEAQDAEARRRWEEAPDRLSYPGGESGEDVARRAGSFLRDLVAAEAAAGSAPVAGPGSQDGGAPNGERRVLVLAHSSLNRVLLCVALDVPLRDYRNRFVQSNANLTVLRFEGSLEDGALLLVANDMSHIRGIQGVTWD